MVVLGRNPSIQMAGLVSSFKYDENKYMEEEALEEYTLVYMEASYEDIC